MTEEKARAKFAKGQVVCIRPSTFERIYAVRESPVGWAYTPDRFKPQRWFPEERLRALTPTERGTPAKRKAGRK